MNGSKNWIFVYMVLHGLLIAVTLVIVWIGWLRQRRIGFLVLVAWALTALFSMACQCVWFALNHSLQNPFQTLFPNAPAILVMLPSFIPPFLLFAGLALLAFRGPPVQSHT